MSILSSPEMFINIKRVPDPSSREYRAFFREEMRKIQEGITINGVKIGGWLYWHINQWMINVDIKNPVTNYIERKLQHPDLRDNDWIISEALEDAEKRRWGLLLLGTRQYGKSEVGASYTGRKCIAFQNSQNIIASLSKPDLSLLTTKIDRGFMNVHPYFRPLKIKDDWKEQITLGYKDPQGRRTPYSELLIRNLDGGKNTENLAGPTTSSLLIEEVGKGSWLEAFIAAQPALETPFGWRCSPLLLGTSGSFEKSEDLQKFREKLDTYKFKEVSIPDIDGKIIHFIPGYYSTKAKRKKIRLSTFLGVEKGSELDRIPIHIVRDKEETAREIRAEIKDFEDSGEFKMAKKKKMYHPLTEEDLFLTDDTDDFYSDVKPYAKEQLDYLESIDCQEEYVWMIRDSVTGKPKTIAAGPNEKPIQEFPTGAGENKDAPIIIWDHPIPGQEFGILHVAGSDPYNQDESITSTSIGTLYVYRRVYDPLKGKFQNSFVACYAARPEKINKWREQVRLLIEYYGATLLPENEEAGFIRWFDEKNIIHYLEDGIDLAKEINPFTQVKRNKGLSASTANIKYGNGIFKNYLMEDIVMGQDPSGDNIIKKGVIRIKHKRLLREIIAHKKGANVDCIVGARHALILASVKDKYFPVAKIKSQQSEEEHHKQIKRSPFTFSKRNPFGSKRRPF